MTHPGWLTRSDTRCYAIPKGVEDESFIKEGELWLKNETGNHYKFSPQLPYFDEIKNDAWREAWEQFKAKQPHEYLEAFGVAGQHHPPDGHVWLVKRECSLPPDPGGTINVYYDAPYYINTLVREDAEPINPMDRERFFQDVQSGKLKSLSPEHAGLRFISAERKCDRGDKLGNRCTMMAGKIDCTYCHGAGTIGPERFDIFRTDHDKGE